jgi:hypothetical protein
VPVLTDVHEYTPMDEVAAVVDVLQTPAFLCRQTDFIRKVCAAGKPVNIKKGQFLSPWDMKPVVEKAKSTGNQHIMVCERGASFGYNNLVSRHALAERDARHRLPGGVRRHPFGAVAGRAGQQQPAASASSCRCWRARRSPSAWPACSWKPIPTRQGAVRRPERLAAGQDGSAAGNAAGAGRDHQARRRTS